MTIWIERDYDSGHLLVHTRRPVKRITKQGSTFWVDENGQSALWSSRINLDLPDLKPGELMEFTSDD